MQQAKELKDRQILDNFYVEIFISLFFNKKSTTPPTLQLVAPYNTDTSRLYDKLKQISFLVIILFFKM